MVASHNTILKAVKSPSWSFNPLHCGAVVASGGGAPRSARRRRRFNPLHCGAVVASRRAHAPHPAPGTRVSIPFIAGQWSLHGQGMLDAGERRHRFNPLHCGAVVASLEGGRVCLRRRHVSIPFIAGQWSLPSPGSNHSTCRPSFNPLHCGAVVASAKLGSEVAEERVFQSPSLRGSGRFWRRGGARRPSSQVSIPFIAGQWSLLLENDPSLQAVRLVSIPFIAGQWSLPN